MNEIISSIAIAHYHHQSGNFGIILNSGKIFSFRAKDVEGLSEASDFELNDFYLANNGEIIIWPSLAKLSVSDIISHQLGSKSHMHNLLMEFFDTTDADSFLEQILPQFILKRKATVFAVTFFIVLWSILFYDLTIAQQILRIVLPIIGFLTLIGGLDFVARMINAITDFNKYVVVEYNERFYFQ